MRQDSPETEQLERVREWATILNRTRRAEAMATLRDESVVLKAVFLDQAGDGECLIYVMKAESFEQAKAAVAKSQHPIDAFHQEFERDT